MLLSGSSSFTSLVVACRLLVAMRVVSVIGVYDLGVPFLWIFHCLFEVGVTPGLQEP